MWKWLDNITLTKRYEGKEIDLIVVSQYFDGKENYPVIKFEIVLHHHYQPIGRCDLRLADNDELYYAGNIGYRIFEKYRGHHYAKQACEILLRLARQSGMKRVIITCSPENIASAKTIEMLGLKYIETVDVPHWHWLYLMDEKVKKIYLMDF